MSRLPETDQGLLRKIRQRDRQALREANASAYNRSGISITAPGVAVVGGVLQSWDFDGTDPANLGAAGWFLGPDETDASRLVLNGVDVYADLAAKADMLASQQTALEAAQADLAEQQATLAATVSDLASRITETTGAATFNTGALPNDATFHEYGPSFAVTVSVPTGRMVVTVGCAEATLNAGGQAVLGEATFSISGGVAAVGSYSSRGYLTAPDVGIGIPLFGQYAFSVTPGTYTITGQMRAWASGTATASVNFRQPFLTVAVTG